VQARRHRKDLADLSFDHPAKRLLKHYREHGVPVKVSTSPWTKEQLDRAMMRGAHKSCQEHLNFLSEEFVDMINKGQWTILPYSVIKELSNLRLSPPGVVPQRDRRPRWIVDYSFYGINQDTLPLIAEDAMQFGHALARILRHILLADPQHGPVYLLKLDIADGFYRIDLCPEDYTTLKVWCSRDPQEPEPLVALPLVLPMGWKNSPPAFCTATETVADLANEAIRSQASAAFHPLGNRAAQFDQLNPTQLPIDKDELQPDPSLPRPASPTSEVDVYVDDFIGIAQGPPERLNTVRNHLLHQVDKVFRPNDQEDTVRAEPVSLKKLDRGDASWKTQHTILGWEVDTLAKTIALPAHRILRLQEILDSIPRSQRRIGVTKWHKVLGELRSMSLALPGSRGLFSHLQAALTLKKGFRVPLNQEVHQALDDFRWILRHIAARPTRIAELVPLLPSALGYHDASGSGGGGVWFPAEHLIPRGSPRQQPLLWRYQWPPEIQARLITDKNPHGTISISDLELAGGILHLDAICKSYDIRERTLLSKTDNLATLFWQRKGSTTSHQVPPYLLRLLGMHQRLHHYVPRHDYIPGGSNPLADDASRLFHLSDPVFFVLF
jgi:Reverse transcriptase (RNA-dependent DNA polymerase).